LTDNILTDAFKPENPKPDYTKLKTTFSSDTPAITSMVKLKNVTGEHEVQWKWISPTGVLYAQSEKMPVDVTRGNYLTELDLWHQLTVKGDAAQRFPGTWKVHFFLDNELKQEKTFTIQKIERALSSESFLDDVDKNIPPTKLKNPDAVAVIIGNKDYKDKDIPGVNYAENDARVMKEYLIHRLGYNPDNIIFRTNATTSDFNDIFGVKDQYQGELYNMIKEGLSDVFIYYSGHGAPDVDSRQGYFVPVNCKRSNSSLRMNGYSLNLFYENISKLPARKMTVVLDACFSGGTFYPNASPIGIAVQNPVLTRTGTICMFSSTGEQVSSWHKEAKHSLFTYYFLKALRGEADANLDKAVTFDEAFKYISDKHNGVPYYARRNFGREQTPVMHGLDVSDELVNDR